MKFLTVIFIFLNLIANSQTDSINIQFRIDNDSFPDCINYYSSNGAYTISETTPMPLELEGFNFIEPKKLIDEGWMTVYSIPQFVDPLPIFQKDKFYYKEISSTVFDSLYQSESKKRSRLSVQEFKREFGISVSVEQVQNNQETILLTPNEGSSIEVISDVVVERTNSQIIDGINLGGANLKIAGLIDGVYLGEKRTYLQRVDYFLEHPQIRDSIQQQHDSIRENFMQPKLDSLLNPYYISKTEVTNREYRAFVHYVRDSLALNKAYWDADEELALSLLNVKSSVRKKLNPKDKEGNLATYSLKMPKDFWEDPIYIPLTSWIYYPQPERYYKRREVDPRKIKYRLNDQIEITIYPDTTAISKIESASMYILSNLYFWHPAYNEYPVIGLNYDQIKAYCHWKQNRINEEMKIDFYTIAVDIPTLTQYEFALKSTQNHLVNEVVNQSNDELVPYFRTGRNEPQQFLRKVHTRPDNINHTEDPLFFNWFKSNYNGSIYFLNGNVSEVIRDAVDEKFITYHSLNATVNAENYCCVIGDNYFIGVKTKDDFQFNALFYKRLISKQQADASTGFRLVYSLEKD